MRTRTRMTAVAAVVAVGALAAFPAVSSAKTVKLNMKITAKPKPTLADTKIKGTITDPTLGKASYKSTIVIPKTTYVIKFKGGTITAMGNGKLEGGSRITTPMKITKGTGKFKKAKGSFIIKGDLNAKEGVPFTGKGKMTY